MTLQEILSRLGTNDDIAKKLKVSTELVEKWYKCEKYPNVEQIRYIAKLTDVSTIDIWLAMYDYESKLSAPTTSKEIKKWKKARY